MPFVSGLLVGFALGIFSIGALAALYLLHRPRYTAPTFHHRRANRDLPKPEVVPPWEREEGGVDYRFINLTGEER